jgi:hypothetical protein
VVATCYLLGVSTRRMEKLVETLGITRLSKSQVSVMAADLDAVTDSTAASEQTTSKHGRQDLRSRARWRVSGLFCGRCR